MEFDKTARGGLISALQLTLGFGLLMIGLGYAGSLWSSARDLTYQAVVREAKLAQCEQMLPNLAIDCPLAAQVAQCGTAYPGSKCEVTR